MIDPTPGTHSDLPRRRLGRTGLEVSVVSAGGFVGMVHDPSRHDAGPWGTTSADASLREKTAVHAVRRAFDLGVNYFDTSPFYGDGEVERLLGVGLRELGGSERDGLVVSTKVGREPGGARRYDADTALRSIERSLVVLGLDRIPLVLVHDAETDEHVDQVLSAGGSLAALERLRAEGVIGFIGIGTRPHSQLRRAIESERFDVVLTPYDLSPVRSSVEPVIELARQHDVGVVAASPYSAGLLAGGDPRLAAAKRPDVDAADLERAVRVWEWADARGLDVGAVAVQFQTRNPDVTTSLVGPRDAHEIEGNVEHARAPIDDATWADLEAFLGSLPAGAPGGERY